MASLKKPTLLFSVILIIFSLFSCDRHDSGFAPEDVSSPSISDGENSFKYGETIRTGNGWEATLSSTDPVEEIELSNGWTVEIRHE